MASATLGKLPEFTDGDNWHEFIERLDAYFSANKITGDDSDTIKHSILLTVCSAKVYSLMKSLLHTEKPTDKSYKDLVDLIESM